MRFVFALLAACAASGPDLVPRAAFELNCPREKLQLTQLAENTWGVTGCEQQATYRWLCDVRGNQCDWTKVN